MKNNTSLSIFLDITRFTCLFYTPLMVIINLFCGLNLNGKLLHWWANLILLAISFIVAIFPSVKKHKSNVFDKIAFKLVFKASIFFTVVSILVNILVLMIENGIFWSLSSILLILLYSISMSIMTHFIKIKSYLASTLIYYVSNCLYFSLLTINIAGLGKGNALIIVIAVFSLSYALLSVIYYLIKKSIKQLDEDEKVYKRQFEDKLSS